MRARWRAAVLVVMVALLLQTVDWRGTPSTPGTSASAEAPRQRAGSAGRLDPRSPSAATKTGAGPDVRRRPVRPPGAVADRTALPPVRPGKVGPRVLSKPPMTSVAAAGQGYDRRTSREIGRGASTVVFRNADGSRTLRLYSGVTNVPRADGTWAPVDLALRAEGSRLVPRAAPFDVSFGRDSADAVVRLDAEHDVRFVPAAAKTEPSAQGEAAGAQVTYREIGPAADLVLNVTSSGVKEDIVLRSPRAATTYDFRLALRGLTPRLDPATGDVTLTGASGRVLATIPAGWMRDAHGAVSDGVRYELRRAGRDWRLRVAVDKAWLADEKRAWPVTVDPSVQINADTDDVYVTKGESVSHPGEIQLKAGSETAGRPSASFLHFGAYSAQLPNQYIRGLSLVLNNAGSATCQPRPVSVFAVGVPWSATSVRWPGPALGNHLSQRSFAHGGTACPAPAWEAFPLDPALATEWTHGTPFHGLSVRAANEADTSAFKRFGATESANKPYLDVTYAPQGASYRVDEVVLPTANQEGRLKATVRNLGSTVWTPSGRYRLGYVVKQGDTIIQTSPTHAPSGDVGPGASRQFDIPMQPLTPGDYQVYLTMYEDGTQFHTAFGVPYGMFPLTVKNVPPSVVYEQPGSGAAVGSLSPALYVEGKDSDNWPNTGLKYNFKLCEGTPEAPTDCVESGWTGPTWTPPAGTLRWSTTYWWWAQAHDNVAAGPWAGPLALTPTVPQPQITSHLGGVAEGTDAPGLDPQVGNFTMATTDAAVATVGPDLTVARTYNSLDPRRDTAFGSGWASRLDTSLKPDDRTTDPELAGNVVVTLPNGRQVRFGRNPDGSYAPPQGQNLTLLYDVAEGRFTLRDASSAMWVFNIHGRLQSITDPDGLTEQLEYDTAGSTGKPKSLYNTVSRRRLHLTWAGPRVTEVRTDELTAGTAAPTWRYTYDGAKLVSACAPGAAPNCTRYDYQAGSRYRSVVIDDDPHGYWRFGEATQAGGATSATARMPGADRGTYHGVVLGAQGAVAGTADTAAAFDGSGSFVALPEKLISQSMSASVELWFRTTSGGVLVSASDSPWGSPAGTQLPVLYVGQDGHLRGGFAATTSTAKQITSERAVDDGAWHHVVLSGLVDRQTLYVDGLAQPGMVAGAIHHDTTPYLTVGAGDSKNWPSGNDADFHFGGSIDELAVYRYALGATAVGEHFAAGGPVDQLTKVTLPQDDRVHAVIGYDDVNDRVATLTDQDGRAWRLDTPLRDEAVRTVSLHGPYPDLSYRYDADHGGRPVSVTTEDGTRTTEYNAAGFVASETDENGHKATFTTDARGNVLSSTTCRTASSCQTSYAAYHPVGSNPLDPRTDRKVSDSDARSSGPDDPAFRTTYAYDTRGRLISATYPKPNGSPVAPVETWTYANGSEPAESGGTVPAGLLLKTTGKRAGQTTVYAYRANGDLAVRTDPSGLHNRFTYDAIGRLFTTTTQAPDGGVFATTTNTYDERSRLSSVTAPAVTDPLTGVRHTRVVRYAYDGNDNTTKVSESDGTGGDAERTTSYRYDAHDALVETTFPDGSREALTYRNAGQERTRTDTRGFVWTTVTDSHDRVLRETVSGQGVDPDDPESTILTLRTNSYDPAGRLAVSRDAIGRETRNTYFDDDRLATSTRVGVGRPDGARSDIVLDRIEYDAAGHVVRRTEAGDRVTETSYDPAGFPKAVTFDPGGLRRSTSYLRDADGLIRRASLGGAGDADPVEHTSYVYDAAGLLIREDVEPTPGDTLSLTYVRDARGLVTERADRRRLPSTYTYDATGALVSESGPETTTWAGGQAHEGVRPTTTFGRNTFGDVTRRRDPNGNVTTIDVDPMGRATVTHLPDYTPPGGTTIRATTAVEYDPAGNPVKVTDGLGRVTTMTYDPYGSLSTTTAPKVGTQPNTTAIRHNRAGEVASVTDPTGAVIASTYDELGRKITDAARERVPSEAWLVTRYAYDDAGNPTSVTSPRGDVTATAYNAAGEPTSVTDPTGRVTRMTYDRAGRPLSVTDPAGLETRTEYDTLGRPTATTQLTGGTVQRTTRQTFDPTGNVATLTSAEGRVRSFGYDGANRVVSQTEQISPTHAIRTSLGYDAAGNRTRFVDGKGNATTYTFTPWGLQESTVEPTTAKTPAAADRSYTTVYDAAGQPVQQIAPGGVTTTTSYDEQGRRVRQTGTGAEASTADRAFGYDPIGRVTSFDAPGGRTTLRYDDRGNLLELRGASGDATFGHDANGRMISRTDASGSTTFAYDGADRLLSTVDGLSGRTVSNTYDGAGRLASTADAGYQQYVKRLYAYDALGRLTTDTLTEADPTGVAEANVLLGAEYGYDSDDKVVRKSTVENNTRKDNTYGYDGAGRLTSWTAPGGAVTPYAWDDAGNRTKAGTTEFTYDERHRLLSDGARGYAYTARGTLSAVTGTGPKTLKSDAFDRTVADGPVTYAYDSLDRVGSRNGTPFIYGSLENDVVSDGTRVVGRGPNGEPFSDKPTVGTTTAKLLYADQHGDVVGRYRGLSTYGKRTFDPFGNVTTTSGSDPSNLGYQGEWTDASTGSVNMAARWYTPGTGGFTARDSWDVAPSPSGAANRYGYGAADPLGSTDPSGHFAIPLVLLVPGAIAGIGAAVVGVGTALDHCAHNCGRMLGEMWDGLTTRTVQGTAMAVTTVTVGWDAVSEMDELARWKWEGRNKPGSGGTASCPPTVCRPNCPPAVCRQPPNPPKPGKPDDPRPTPPRLPRWAENLIKEVVRGPAGRTTVPRPEQQDATDENTAVIERNLAEVNTQVIDDTRKRIGLGEEELAKLRAALETRTRDSKGCLTGFGKSDIPHDYWPLRDARATGANACLNHADDLAGSHARAIPKDWSKGCGLDRAHLIACSFGGDGTIVANLVPTTPSANRRGMYWDFEYCVSQEMKTNQQERIAYLSVPVYGADHQVLGVAMAAVGNQGYRRGRFIPNEVGVKHTYTAGKKCS